MNHEYRWEELTASQLRKRLAESPLVLLPMGSIEWHGDHCATGLDHQVAIGPVEAAARELGVIRLPPVFWGGDSPEGDLPGSLIVRVETLEQLLIDIIESVKAHGVRALLGVSGHGSGGQNEVIHRINARYADDPDIDVHLALAAKLVMDTGVDGDAGTPVIDHAGAVETSLQLATAAHRVRLGDLPASEPLLGVIGGDPRTGSSAAAGRKVSDLFRQATVHQGKTMLAKLDGAHRAARESAAVCGRVTRRGNASPDVVEYLLLYNRRRGIRSYEIPSGDASEFAFDGLEAGPYTLMRWRWRRNDAVKPFSQAGDCHRFTLAPGEQKHFDLVPTAAVAAGR